MQRNIKLKRNHLKNHEAPKRRAGKKKRATLTLSRPIFHYVRSVSGEREKSHVYDHPLRPGEVMETEKEIRE